MPKKKATKKKKVLLESEKLEGWNDTKDKFTLNLIRSGNYDLKRTEHRYLQTIYDQFDLFENTPRTIFYKHWRELKKKDAVHDLKSCGKEQGTEKILFLFEYLFFILTNIICYFSC